VSVCPVHCGKTADRIWMLFGIVDQMGPGMRKVVGFWDRSMGGGNFGANMGHPIVTNGEFDAACFQITFGRQFCLI